MAHVLGKQGGVAFHYISLVTNLKNAFIQKHCKKN